MELFETLADMTKPEIITKENRHLLDSLKEANNIKMLKSIRDGFLRDQELSKINIEDQEIVKEIDEYLAGL